MVEVASSLPGVERLPEGLRGVPRVDLLVTVSGFEQRTSAIPTALRSHGIELERACYVTYRTNEEQNAAARADLLRELSLLGVQPEQIDGDDDVRVVAEGLRAAVRRSSSETGHRPVVLLDISGASGRMILRLVHALLECDIRLFVGYAQARVYHPEEKRYREWLRDRAETQQGDHGDPGLEAPTAAGAAEDDTLGLDTDVMEVEASIDYPGQHMDYLPDRVVVFAGFNGERSRAVLSTIDSALVVDHPSEQVTWVVGEPLLDRDRWRLDAMLEVNGLKDPASGKAFESVVALSTFDYLETLRELERQYDDSFGSERITVAPMGSKMQTLATALFCEMRPDVRVLLSRPLHYSSNEYTDGVEEVWVVPLGDTEAVRSLFASLGQVSLSP